MFYGLAIEELFCELELQAKEIVSLDKRRITPPVHFVDKKLSEEIEKMGLILERLEESFKKEAKL